MENVLDGAEKTQARLVFSTNVVQLHPGDQCVLLRTESTDATVRKEGSQVQEGARTQQ